MGVDAEDVDGDGRPELFVTNYINEYNAIYRNMGRVGFVDATNTFGLAVDTLNWVGWGCALADFDNDGWPDCFVANGSVDAYTGRRGRTNLCRASLLAPQHGRQTVPTRDPDRRPVLRQGVHGSRGSLRRSRRRRRHRYRRQPQGWQACFTP